MSNWRSVGLNYIRYSNIAARVLRGSLKPNLRTEAAKREDSHVKFTPWKEGKPIKKTEESKRSSI